MLIIGKGFKMKTFLEWLFIAIFGMLSMYLIFITIVFKQDGVQVEGCHKHIFFDNGKEIICSKGTRFNCGYDLDNCSNKNTYQCVVNIRVIKSDCFLYLW